MAARIGSSSPALFGDSSEGTAEIDAEIIEFRGGGIRLDVHDDVNRPFVEQERLPFAPVHLARPSLQLVPDVGLADFLRGRDSDPRTVEHIRGEEENGVAREKFSAGLVDVKEFTPLRQPGLPGKRLRPVSGARQTFHRRTCRVADQTARRLRPLRRRRESTA
jgi:hypothetical protein